MILIHIVQGLGFLLLAPLVVGTLRLVKARLQRREGPPVYQFYLDLHKLLRKRPILPDGASWVFLAAPIVVFACYAALGFLAPVVFLPLEEISTTADLILLIGLLGLARLTMGLAGMDPGAPFGGIGSSREMFLHVLAEPTLLMVAYALALKWRTTDLTLILWQNFEAGPLGIYTSPPLMLLGIALALVTLIEAGRLPFDNPATHLELTMFGKATHLEYGGVQLALIEWAEALRLTFFLTLLVNLFLPWALAAAGRGWIANAVLVVLYPIKLAFAALILAGWEATQVKTRLRAVFTPALTALAVAVMAALLAVVERYLL